jgi:hypothetical protein
MILIHLITIEELRSNVIQNLAHANSFYIVRTKQQKTKNDYEGQFSHSN